MANNRELSQFASVVGYNDGNIGIGTDNPSAPLHLSGADSADAKIKIEDNNNGFAASEIGVENGGRDLKIAAPQDIYFEDVDTGVRHLYIESGGNVGIGTEDPAHKLDLYNSAGTDCLKLNVNGGAGGSSKQNAIRFSVDGDVKAHMGLAVDAGRLISGSIANDFCLKGLNLNNILFATNSSERLRIDSSGRLLKSGQASLTSTSLPHPIQIAADSSAQNIACIGRASDDISAIDFYEADKTTNLGEIQYRPDHVNFRHRVGDIRFATGGTTERLRIKSNGVVQVANAAHGSDNGSRLLEVIGSGNSQAGFYIANNATSASGTCDISFAPSNKITGAQIFCEAQEDFSTGANRTADLTFVTRKDGTLAEKVRITSSGRLLVGHTSLTGDGDSAHSRIVVNGNTTATSKGGILSLENTATAISSVNNGNQIGQLFFKTETGEEFGLIKVEAEANATSSSCPARMMFFTTATSATTPTERMRIGKDGETTLRPATYGMGVRSIAGSSSVNTAYFGAHSSTSMSTGTITYEVYTNGNVKNSNNSYSQLSDERLKENIIDAPSQWDDIKSLRIRKYNFRDNNGYETHTQIGLVAQEVEAVSPGLVQETPVREDATPVLDAEGNELEATKSVLTSVLYMKSVKALQEAQTRIETLESQHADLLARVTALEGS